MVSTELTVQVACTHTVWESNPSHQLHLPGVLNIHEIAQGWSGGHGGGQEVQICSPCRDFVKSECTRRNCR